MKVWVYPEKRFEEFGAERWTCEWQELKESAKGKAQDDIDFDSDLITRITAHKTKDAALKKARSVAGNSFFGASVMLQRVDWFVEKDRIAEWVNVGEAEYV